MDNVALITLYALTLQTLLVFYLFNEILTSNYEFFSSELAVHNNLTNAFTFVGGR